MRKLHRRHTESEKAEYHAAKCKFYEAKVKWEAFRAAYNSYQPLTAPSIAIEHKQSEVKRTKVDRNSPEMQESVRRWWAEQGKNPDGTPLISNVEKLTSGG